MEGVSVKLQKTITSARFGSTHIEIGTIQRSLAWPLRNDDTHIHEAFHIKKNKPTNKQKKQETITKNLHDARK